LINFLEIDRIKGDNEENNTEIIEEINIDFV
jgi:hypothetical protein